MLIFNSLRLNQVYLIRGAKVGKFSMPIFLYFQIISVFVPMFQIEDFMVDVVYGERLLISKSADPSELEENIRVARVLLSCFDDMKIRINEHLLVFGQKNPEYTINEKLGDR